MARSNEPKTARLDPPGTPEVAAANAGGETKAARPARPEPAVALKSARTPFSLHGEVVRYKDQTIMRHVGGVTVLNTTLRTGLTAAETEVFDDILLELRLLQRPVHRVAHMSDFFNGPQQFARMSTAPEAENRQLAAAVGLVLADEDYAALANYKRVEQKVLAFYKNAGPQYVFAKKTGNDSKLTVTGTTVGNGRYTMSRKQAAKVWERARAVWEANSSVNSGTASALQGYSSQRFNITETNVQIGCQTLSRWQVEQAAADMGLIE